MTNFLVDLIESITLQNTSAMKVFMIIGPVRSWCMPQVERLSCMLCLKTDFEIAKSPSVARKAT
ncbi:hypothetical protein COCNU_contig69137961G000010 [Cocos nucifera]|nr:hypothetical protein [Cocos nucifera]